MTIAVTNLNQLRNQNKSMFKKWIARRKEKSRLNEYLRGYDYAAGVLLRNGDCSIGDLLSESDSIDQTSFDLGVREAISDFQELGRSLV